MANRPPQTSCRGQIEYSHGSLATNRPCHRHRFRKPCPREGRPPGRRRRARTGLAWPSSKAASPSSPTGGGRIFIGSVKSSSMTWPRECDRNNPGFRRWINRSRLVFDNDVLTLDRLAAAHVGKNVGLKRIDARNGGKKSFRPNHRRAMDGWRWRSKTASSGIMWKIWSSTDTGESRSSRP